MLGVDLGKAEHLGVGQRTAEFLGEGFEISLFVGAEGESFAEIVFVDVLDSHNRVGLAVDVEHL